MGSAEIKIDEYSGVSYAGAPKSSTALFVTKKVQHLLTNLEGVSDCLVFVEEGSDIPDYVRARHRVVEAKNPQLLYARFVQDLVDREGEVDRAFPPELTRDGYCVAPNARVSKSARIEPGAVIFNDVTIGEYVEVHSGAVIRHADIGDGSIVESNACIGEQGFNFARGENGDLVRIPCAGRVRIGKNVEIGCCATVCRGMAGDTVLGDSCKVDGHVHVGHDVNVGANTEITAGTIIGGYCDIGKSCFIGLNSTLKNRIKIGDGAFVAMGSTVIRGVEAGSRVIGNPAKPMRF